MKPDEYYCIENAVVRIDSIEDNVVTYVLYNKDGSYSKQSEPMQKLLEFLGVCK